LAFLGLAVTAAPSSYAQTINYPNMMTRLNANTNPSMKFKTIQTYDTPVSRYFRKHVCQ